MYKSEIEYSYSMVGGKVNEALELVWPPDGTLRLRSISYVIVGIAIASSVHFFSSDSNLAHKRRLRISSDRGLRGILDEKLWNNGTKLENTLKKAKGNEVLDLLMRFGPISGALAKERVTLSYFSNRDSFDLSVDRFVPFHPNCPECSGAIQYHLEIEAKHESVLALVDECLMSHAEFVSSLRDEETKWLMASKYCPSPCTLLSEFLEEFPTYLALALSRLRMEPGNSDYR